MKSLPLNKLARFIMTDREVILRVAILIVLLFIILIEMTVLRSQSREMAVLKARQSREHVAARPVVASPPIEKAKGEYILQGVTLKSGVPYAVISGEIYKQGDAITKYVLVEIGKGFIVLEDSESKERKNVYFSEKLPGDVFPE